VLPSPAVAWGWWWPGAVVGGVVFGAVTLATLPLWALSAAFVPPPGPYWGAPPAYWGAPPAYWGCPPAYWGAAPMDSGAPPGYSAPGYTAPPTNFAPPPDSAPPIQFPQLVPSPTPEVQREIVFPNGRYLLFGDGVTQPWQWAWEPAGASPPDST